MSTRSPHSAMPDSSSRGGRPATGSGEACAAGRSPKARSSCCGPPNDPRGPRRSVLVIRTADGGRGLDPASSRPSRRRSRSIARLPAIPGGARDRRRGLGRSRADRDTDGTVGWVRAQVRAARIFRNRRRRRACAAGLRPARRTAKRSSAGWSRACDSRWSTPWTCARARSSSASRCGVSAETHAAAHRGLCRGRVSTLRRRAHKTANARVIARDAVAAHSNRLGRGDPPLALRSRQRAPRDPPLRIPPARLDARDRAGDALASAPSRWPPAEQNRTGRVSLEVRTEPARRRAPGAHPLRGAARPLRQRRHLPSPAPPRLTPAYRDGQSDRGGLRPDPVFRPGTQPLVPEAVRRSRPAAGLPPGTGLRAR